MNKRYVCLAFLALMLFSATSYSFGNLIAENQELRSRLSVAEKRVDKMLPQWVNEGVEVE